MTPLRDGLNLVAKEFVVAQDSSNPGVLVLSKFAGAAVELSDAVITNPYHPEGLACDLDLALRMTPLELLDELNALHEPITVRRPLGRTRSCCGIRLRECKSRALRQARSEASATPAAPRATSEVCRRRRGTTADRDG